MLKIILIIAASSLLAAYPLRTASRTDDISTLRAPCKPDLQLRSISSVRRRASKRDEVPIDKKLVVADPSKPIEGYLNTDLAAMDDSKLSRVFAYILIALLPCLLLVPFYMSRSFVPADM